MGSPPAAPAPSARGACSSRSRRPRRGRSPHSRARAASRSGVCVSHACWPSRWTIRYASSRCIPAATSASSTRWENSAPDVISRFARIRSACTVIPRTTRSVSASTWSSRIVESGSTIRSARGVRDVALVPERDVLEPHLGVAAQHAREARRCARRRPGCACAASRSSPSGPARNGSSTSRTSVRCRWRISVAKRSRPGAGQRDRGQQLRVAVARDDLGGDRLGRRPRRRDHALLVVRARASRTCRRRRRSRP